METSSARLQEILDRIDIQDVMYRYARGVDRGDMQLIRSTYHPDAHDDHVEYKGNVEGLIAWLSERFSQVDNSTHLIGNCLIEFFDSCTALVETYYNSRRIRPPTESEASRMQSNEFVCRQSWGRYVDRFEKREGVWRVAHRVVVLESRFTAVVSDAQRDDFSTWGQRDQTDPYILMRAELLANLAP